MYRNFVQIQYCWSGLDIDEALDQLSGAPQSFKVYFMVPMRHQQGWAEGCGVWRGWGGEGCKGMQ